MSPTPDEAPLLAADGLTKWYGRQLGCRDVTFELYEGEVLAVVAPCALYPAARFLDPARLRPDMSPVLELRAARKSFTMHLQGGLRLPVVEGVDFAVAAGQCVVLAGPSGAG